MRNKVIITCAVTGAIHTPSMSPHLPVTPDEIAQAAIGAAEAGAAVIHLHPDLLDRVRERWVATTDDPLRAEGIDWRPDEGLGPLDCVVESPAGCLLAGLPAQIERIDTLLRTTMAARTAVPMAQDALEPICKELA